MIEYFRLHIEYLWNAVDLKKTEHGDSLNIQFAIINSQFYTSGGSGLGFMINYFQISESP